MSRFIAGRRLALSVIIAVIAGGWINIKGIVVDGNSFLAVLGSGQFRGDAGGDINQTGTGVGFNRRRQPAGRDYRRI